MRKNNLLYIEHIFESIENILSFNKGLDQQGFLENKMVQDATIRNLEIIGEATKGLSEDFEMKYPEIEWKKMAGMRDKLIHDYIGVDLWAVWEVVDKILPSLKDRISDIIEQNL